MTLDDYAVRAHRVRASEIVTHAVCARRYWARTLPELVQEAHGLHLPPDSNVKAFIGTMVHWLAEHNIQEFNELAYKVVSDVCSEEHRNFYTPGWSSEVDICRGAWKMYQALRRSEEYEPWLDPRSLREIGGEVKLQMGMTLTGTIELVGPDGVIRDIKTSAWMSGIDYSHQMCAYYAIADKCGMKPKPVARIVKIKRPASVLSGEVIEVRADEIPVKKMQYKLERRISKIARQADKLDAWRGDLRKLPANPDCWMCRFCSLRSTRACPETSRPRYRRSLRGTRDRPAPAGIARPQESGNHKPLVFLGFMAFVIVMLLLD